MTYFELYEEIKSIRSQIPIGSIWENTHNTQDDIHITGVSMKEFWPRGKVPYIEYELVSRDGYSRVIGLSARAKSLLESNWKRKV